MTEFGFGKFVSIKLKSEAGFALQDLMQDVRIPAHTYRWCKGNDFRHLETSIQ
jgi:hypothetical protein